MIVIVNANCIKKLIKLKEPNKMIINVMNTFIWGKSINNCIQKYYTNISV